MENQLEVVPTDAISLQLKAEVDVMISTAKAFPRDLKRCIQNAIDMATMNDEIAESCGYAVPRTETDRITGEKKQILIKGPSVRLAEIICSTYGNIRYAKRILGGDGKRVTGQGVCHDIEGNIHSMVEISANTVYKNGNPYNEDLSNMIGNAAASKAFRNSAFSVIPRALVNVVYEETLRKIAGSSENLSENIEKAMKFFSDKNVPEEKILKSLGVKSRSEITQEKLVVLRGFASFIKNEGGTVEDIVNPKDEAQENPEEKHRELDMRFDALKKRLSEPDKKIAEEIINTKEVKSYDKLSKLFDSYKLPEA